MPCDYRHLPHPGIQSLSPYKPGKSIEELAHEQGLTDIIKLASNENPLGCSPLVREALARMPSSIIAAYPAPAHHDLLAKLGKKLDIDPRMITLSNGSDLIFFLLLTAFALGNKKQMLTHQYAFITYAIQAQILNIPIKTIPTKQNFEVDITGMIEEASRNKTAIIFIANPNNPTGLLIKHDEIKRLITEVPKNTIIVLDEAYSEYSHGLNDKRTMNLLEQHPNLVITRTFSKIYGLAGLRLGYALASTDITDILLRIQLPFTVNRAAMDAAYAALDDEQFIAQSLEQNNMGMQQLLEGLEQLNLESIPSSANFITFDCKKDSLPVYEALLKEGIIVRPLHPYNLNQYLRVTIGTTEQNVRFLDTLKRCINV